MHKSHGSNVQIIREAIDHRRPVDGQVASAVHALSQRLQRLKRACPALGAVTFSEHVERLEHRAAAAV